MRILSFSISDLVAYSAPVFIGSLFDSIFVIPVAGIVGVVAVRRFLKRFPPFYGVRWLYWSLPSNRFNRMLRVNLPPSSKQFWVK